MRADLETDTFDDTQPRPTRGRWLHAVAEEPAPLERPGPLARVGALVTPRVAIALAVATLVLPALVLRLYHINILGFNSDEAVYAGQAAAIAGQQPLSGLFPVFRAHPLLFQTLMSLPFHVQVSDLVPRLLAVAFGLGTVAAGYAAGARIYGRSAGLLTALFLAVMPYLVVVNRQALLDGPMVFFSVVALWLLARYADLERPRALYAAGAVMGLAFLTKETAVLLLPAAYAFLAMTPAVRLKLKDLAISFACFVVVALPYPVSLALGGGSSSGRHFLVWQLFRPPNHAWDFYLTVVPLAIGLPLMALAAGSLVAAVVRRRWSWRESLLVCWIVVPALFLQLWPVKGFQYLLPAAAPVAVLAAGLIAGTDVSAWLNGLTRRAPLLKALVAALVVVWLAWASWAMIGATPGRSFLAGTGGVPGGREAGAWIRTHTPAHSELLAIGPSMANIIQWYGERRALGLSVSPNPLRRNPVYTPVANPDLLLRSGQVQYLVWDSYSAARTSFFTEKLMTYVRRYSGFVVHTTSIPVDTTAGLVSRPVIIVYEVRP